jgi:hypothetical protein
MAKHNKRKAIQNLEKQGKRWLAWTNGKRGGVVDADTLVYPLLWAEDVTITASPNTLWWNTAKDFTGEGIVLGRKSIKVNKSFALHLIPDTRSRTASMFRRLKRRIRTFTGFINYIRQVDFASDAMIKWPSAMPVKITDNTGTSATVSFSVRQQDSTWGPI